LAIIKALEAIGNIDTTTNSQRTATIFTNSMITLESIKNTKNHNYLIEEIKKKDEYPRTSTLEHRNLVG